MFILLPRLGLLLAFLLRFVCSHFRNLSVLDILSASWTETAVSICCQRSLSHLTNLPLLSYMLAHRRVNEVTHPPTDLTQSMVTLRRYVKHFPVNVSMLLGIYVV